ncbi:MAG: hypothetical protein KDA72_19245 [Planctomycetales bacterium]|nr:hypothetical protein [Planctomycetales bacterium]
MPMNTPKIRTYQLIRERIQAERVAAKVKKSMAQVERVAATPVVVSLVDKRQGSLPVVKTASADIPRHKRELGRRAKV